MTASIFTAATAKVVNPNAEEHAKVVDYLNTALSALFPGLHTRAYTRCIIGEYNVHVWFGRYTNREDCPNGIWENDPMLGLFAIFNEGGKFKIGHPTTHGRGVTDAGTSRFITIKADTEQQAAEKLVKWFTKNQQVINDYAAQF